MIPLPRSANAKTVLRNELYEQQGGFCAACGSDDPGSNTGWHLDHCHESDLVRGVLCQGCNFALGLVGDSVERLHALIAYLETFGEQRERARLDEDWLDYVKEVVDDGSIDEVDE